MQKNGEVIKSYTYGDASWKDLLTAFNGQSITYDAIGNPLSYRGMTLSWAGGRRLASVSKEGLSASYVYNSDGIRTQKTVNGVTTNYYLDGNSILRQVTGNDVLEFFYDANGVLGFYYNNTPYYYLKNLQGDIVGILDANGTQVVSYTYDAWGAPLSVTGTAADTIGQLNPFRYRSYYYDNEIGLYYLNSRYYDPETYRFINADNQIAIGNTLVGINLFSYCGSNPISRADEDGEFWNIVIGAAVGGIVGGVIAGVSSYMQTGKVDWGSVAINALVGAASGAIAATGLPIWAQAGITAVISGVGNFADQAHKKKGFKEVNYKEVAVNAVLGAATSVAGSAVGRAAGGGIKDSANKLIKAGRDKMLTGVLRRAVGQSHSALIRQADKFLVQGTVKMNTYQGLSSVMGTGVGIITSTGYNIVQINLMERKTSDA